MAPTPALRALAEPLLADAGLELWDVEVGTDVVRVLVDRTGGVDLDALSDASRVLSGLLDEHDELVPAGRYSLEISSPGLERTLRTPEHFGRYVGTTLKVKTSVPVDGARRHQGVLVAADDDSIELDAGDGPHRRIPLAEVERARTVFEWGPSPKPGGPRRSTPSRRAAGSPAGAGAHERKDTPR